MVMGYHIVLCPNAQCVSPVLQLEIAVRARQFDLLLHPVFDRLIALKWERMGW